MTIPQNQIGDVTVLKPQGDMDLLDLPAFEAQVRRLFADGPRHLVWDLSRLNFLQSTAAGFLLQTARRVRQAGGHMALVGGSRRVLGTLRTMGVLDIFATYASLDEALATLQP